MEIFYSNEKNVQILIALMKEHHIKKVIVSPGATNITFVASIQNDPYFEIYSSIDERSAAYLACGMAAESGAPIALSCTGATAARNYVPGLTEAYYRKLPVLAITSSRPNREIGQNIPQVTDRRFPMPDIAKISVQIPVVNNGEQEWECQVQINKALLELRRHGGGPAHINLMTTYSADFSVKKLYPAKPIFRICKGEELPDLEAGRIGIYVGAHLKWSATLTEAVESFCEKYDAAVICDQTSNYKGKYGVEANLVGTQEQYCAECCNMKHMIHIGDVSGAYMHLFPDIVWRVNPDGEVRDTFRKLQYVFEMDELFFFQSYVERYRNTESGTNYYKEWRKEYDSLVAKAAERSSKIPFSNAWIAQQTIPHLPECQLHLGILNSLRTWSFFEMPKNVLAYSNVGGFGIDGGLSSLVGASLADPKSLHIGVFGDLAFFYDMNALGNRHIGSNLRILLVNNGKGTEFRGKGNLATAAGIGDATDIYIAAAGHFGNQSRRLVKDYAEDLRFQYIKADDKKEYLECLNIFLSKELTDRPILFEVFTNSSDETEGLDIMRNLEESVSGIVRKTVKEVLGARGLQKAKGLLGDKGVQVAKQIIKG